MQNSQLKLQLKRKQKNGKTKDVFEHDVLTLLDKVNNFMTFMDLLKYTQMHRELTGEAYWLVERTRLTNSPAELWPLMPHKQTLF